MGIVTITTEDHERLVNALWERDDLAVDLDTAEEEIRRLREALTRIKDCFLGNWLTQPMAGAVDAARLIVHEALHRKEDV